ncbi:alpha-L-fucosidase [Cochliomyia hominivorax]
MESKYLIIILFVAVCVKLNSSTNVATKYEPNWSSLDKRPLPQWYDDAKVGIFIHWGVYSVPSMGSEWFWTDWKNLKYKNYIEFMEKNYKPGFSYQDFANEFTAELFNATQWSLLFNESGAKYVVLTSKHHDGYCLWPSEQSFGWNSMDVGPKRDIIRELSSALRKNTDLKFGLYYSLFEWFNRMYINDKLHIFLKDNYVVNKVRPEQIFLVQEYMPEILWSDGDWEAPDKYWKSEEFIAWLYNDSPVRDTIVTNDRWGFGTACQHGDFYNCQDRFNPGVLKSHKWENAFTLDKQSWGQRYDVTLKDFMTSEDVIQELVTTISCNGNVLINVGPTKYGTILPIFEERLRDMGHWLKINGEAIYASKPWLYQNDTITPFVWYTSKIEKDKQLIHIYAIVLEYPYDTNSITIYPWGNASSDYLNVHLVGLELFNSIKDRNINSIVMLGVEDIKIKWSLKGSALDLEFPAKNQIDKRGLKYAWTFRITVNNEI